jgi:hypothetical protein
MLASPSLFLPQMRVLRGGAEGETPFCVVLSVEGLALASARVASAPAILPPASGPSPLLARIKCSRGRWAERKLMRGSCAVGPKALSERLTVCR